MVKLIVGKKGTGKTKILLENLKRVSDENRGSIILINNSEERVSDLDLSVRVINAKEYSIRCCEEFLGFIKGATSQNYDITNIFVDGLFKIVGDDVKKAAELIKELGETAKRSNIDFYITVSADKDELPSEIYEYII